MTGMEIKIPSTGHPRLDGYLMAAIIVILLIIVI
jgi:hypothetical protein